MQYPIKVGKGDFETMHCRAAGASSSCATTRTRRFTSIDYEQKVKHPAPRGRCRLPKGHGAYARAAEASLDCEQHGPVSERSPRLATRRTWPFAPRAGGGAQATLCWRDGPPHVSQNPRAPHLRQPQLPYADGCRLCRIRSIMLEGENGSGKSTLLHSIYLATARRAGRRLRLQARQARHRDGIAYCCSTPSSTTRATIRICSRTSRCGSSSPRPATAR